MEPIARIRSKIVTCPLLGKSEPTNMKIAYRAKDIMEAEIIKGMLLANGIEAHTSGFYLQGAIGDLAAADFSKVHVHDDDFARARELVKEYEGQLSDHDTSHIKIENSKPTTLQKFIIPVIFLIAISVLLYWLGT